jgi:hypothetical protein
MLTLPPTLIGKVSSGGTDAHELALSFCLEAIMRILSGIAIGLVTAWTVTQVNPAGAQDFDERFSIIPKANASEPNGENQPVPQTEPSSVPQSQPLNEAKSTSGPEDRSTTRSSKRSFTGRAASYSYRTGKTAAHARKATVVREPRVRLIVRVPVVSPTPWDYYIVPRYRYRPQDDRIDPYGPPVVPVVSYGPQEVTVPGFAGTAFPP